MTDEVTVSVRIKTWPLINAQSMLDAWLDFWQNGWYGGVVAYPPTDAVQSKVQIQLQNDTGTSLSAGVGDVIVKMGAIYEVLSAANYEAKYGLS